MTGQSEQTADLYAALIRAQAECQNIAKTRSVSAGKYNYEYAELHAVRDDVAPIFAKHGLGIVPINAVVDGRDAVVTRIIHTTGQWLDIPVFVAIPDGDPRGAGSANTYGRRYGLKAAANIAEIDEDDDGGAAAQQASAFDPASARERCFEALAMRTHGKHAQRAGELIAGWHERFNGTPTRQDYRTLYAQITSGQWDAELTGNVADDMKPTATNTKGKKQ